MSTPENDLIYFGALAESLPNLDGYTDPDELAEFQLECHRVEQTLAALRSYAEAKRHAMEMRLKGRVDMAIRFESAAEQVYAKLPDFAKW